MKSLFSPAGKLLHRIAVYKISDGAPTSMNEAMPTAPNVPTGTSWGSIEPIAGRELWYGRQVTAETTHGVKLRYKPAYAGLNSRWRLIFQGRTFEIISAWDIDERKIEFAIMAKEAKAGA